MIIHALLKKVLPSHYYQSFSVILVASECANNVNKDYSDFYLLEKVSGKIPSCNANSLRVDPL